ncbi:hypothetical protein FIBSPDRAFT_927162 [Athelia psychrophila]|uniref:GST N-terminal domain-containing protein n=1 Tax=Athelia psychrophila TaxID=1759441 RepID=A0A166S6G0_9AGAM|nr:hypothetical protein FIBSPDRAFT_927162 [Fibularhizoctonia sp. CBS 109695]
MYLGVKGDTSASKAVGVECDTSLSAAIPTTNTKPIYCLTEHLGTTTQKHTASSIQVGHLMTPIFGSSSDTPGCFFQLQNVRETHLRELGVSVWQMAMQIIGLLDPRTPFSTFTRTISLGLHRKDIPFHQVHTAPHSATANAHHPFGFLPTLIIPGDGKIKLRETQAIVRYVDRVVPEPSLHLPEGDSHSPEQMWEVVSLIAAFAGSAPPDGCYGERCVTEAEAREAATITVAPSSRRAGRTPPGSCYGERRVTGSWGEARSTGGLLRRTSRHGNIGQGSRNYNRGTKFSSSLVELHRTAATANVASRAQRGEAVSAAAAQSSRRAGRAPPDGYYGERRVTGT